ncbi:putative exonuclease [Aspergillus clavatus NRRL 1]|uniref:Exonuclease, putative n=1 Tax=Aspergillus clavatus (strain ATCC 1007 / CBS 513.65 / DSM 816 / NCTC 3887 / NRRL 1 / QM 1276 / 107) TaxID=344612 RepID=A1CK21_ASPCL|nr:exonuclease, putative [Aspergillus clavatus NRRL 1]EAW09495.1 exonuclease, putative [Aspergillus clavatus NRRL 1]
MADCHIGLHGLLKSIQKPCHLKKFNGQTLGVDAYGWLHRGTVACAVDLVLERPNTKHLDFVLNRVRMLLFFGVTPYLVFDGDDLPSKSGTESERLQRRQASKALGLELQRKGRTAEAYQELQKAVDVTPNMARQLIEELKKMEVQYVVAPYEADAQLVYLEREGIIDGIISEDSDLLVFGAKRLLSKLDQHGECIEINRADFTACREVSLIGWTDADFRRMCILSGCDYLANIPRMGLKTAYRSIRKYKNVEKSIRMLQFDGQYQVPADYLKKFQQAELTFLYQRVFCPKAGKLVTLTPPEKDIILDELPFIGGDVDPEIAVGIARGDLHPTTKQEIVLKPLAPRRPLNAITRRQTLGSSAELKAKKPIDTFFTPKRVPLAELDPNSLTPSPSQQRLLERHANTSWEGRAAPSRPGVVGSAPVPGLSHRISSPLIRSVERNSFLAHAAKVSTFQPAKRQRLCAETEEESLPDRADCRSRFFAPCLDNSSPSGLKATRTKRKSNLGVFSDELAEQIMTQIPDPEVSTSESTEAVDSSPGPLLEAKDKRDEKPVLSSFVFKSPAHDRISTASRPPGQPRPSGLSPRRRLTPLQRMGRTALARSRSVNALPQVKAFAPPRIMERSATTLAQGSEDMIIPNSDDDEEEEEDAKSSQPLVDLKKFLYAK